MFVIANWKLNLTTEEVKSWVETFNIFSQTYSFNKVIPIICPTFVHLPYLKSNLINAKIGSQEVSCFSEGAHTGEVSAKQLKDFVSYSIIGHSERRNQFGETDEIVVEKAKLCVENNITPIICVSTLDQVKPLKVSENILIAFEPLSAIGSGNPDSSEHIENTASGIINIVPTAKVLYGGSVLGENIESLSKLRNIAGFLVGTESLKAESFITILKTCDT